MLRAHQPGGGGRLHHRSGLRVHFRLVYWPDRGALRETRHPRHLGAQLPRDGIVARRHRSGLGADAGVSVQPVPRPVQGSHGGHDRSRLDVRIELLYS